MWDKLREWFDGDEAAELSIEDPDLFIKIIAKAASFNKEGTLTMWADGNELLVGEEKYANLIVNGLERATGLHCFVTGYYDPREDIADSCVDKYTGWHYVSMV